MNDILYAWSGGKDSALGLHDLLASGGRVAALLTTVTEDYGRISMHGVREELLRRQAAALDLPLDIVYIRVGATNDDYSAVMRAKMDEWRGKGVTRVAFADIFLEDLRRWREERLAEAGMTGVFPLWKQPTTALARRFLNLGFHTVISCVDGQAIDGSFSGREYDESFLRDLPESADPCGENGEFHSFCYAGPIFSAPVRFTRGETVLREGRFHFTDLIPED